MKMLGLTQGKEPFRVLTTSVGRALYRPANICTTALTYSHAGSQTIHPCLVYLSFTYVWQTSHHTKVYTGLMNSYRPSRFQWAPVRAEMDPNKVHQGGEIFLKLSFFSLNFAENKKFHCFIQVYTVGYAVSNVTQLWSFLSLPLSRY